jgi:hypothetical protein
MPALGGCICQVLLMLHGASCTVLPYWQFADLGLLVCAYMELDAV